MKSAFLLLTPLCIAALSNAALAQAAPPADAPPPDAPPVIQLSTPATPYTEPSPKIDLSTAANGPAVPRTYHVHEGFYLRTSVGFGSYKSSFTDNKRGNSEYSDDGGSMSLDLLLGGSPVPGVAIGGGLLLDPQFGREGGVSALIGPFIDGFPDVNKGWHLGGQVGLGVQSFQNVRANDRQRANGIGGAFWFGYDFWVAGEWAIGPQVRVLGMRTNDGKSGEDVSAFARSITFGISSVFN
ncbi:MAG: hypothetical protein ABIQ16_13725 [Polyangiaceae bacterium]